MYSLSLGRALDTSKIMVGDYFGDCGMYFGPLLILIIGLINMNNPEKIFEKKLNARSGVFKMLYKSRFWPHLCLRKGLCFFLDLQISRQIKNQLQPPQ